MTIGLPDSREVDALSGNDRVAADLLSCLRRHGQRVDAEIAEEVGVSVSEVRSRFAPLLESGEVVACKLMRFEKGKSADFVMYRASGYFPPRAPGRKATPPPAA